MHNKKNSHFATHDKNMSVESVLKKNEFFLNNNHVDISIITNDRTHHINQAQYEGRNIISDIMRIYKHTFPYQFFSFFIPAKRTIHLFFGTQICLGPFYLVEASNLQLIDLDFFQSNGHSWLK